MGTACTSSSRPAQAGRLVKRAHRLAVASWATRCSGFKSGVRQQPQKSRSWVVLWSGLSGARVPRCAAAPAPGCTRAAGVGRTAHASGRRTQLLVRHGQNALAPPLGRQNFWSAGSPRLGLRAATPQVAVGCAARSGIWRARDRTQSRVEHLRRWLAVLPGGTGVAVRTGADQWVEARVLAWLPDAWVNLRRSGSE